MSKKTYRKYLESGSWKRFRASALKTRGCRCEVCFVQPGKRRLHLHHVRYSTLGNEQPLDVIVVCIECHAHLEGAKKGEGRGGRHRFWAVRYEARLVELATQAGLNAYRSKFFALGPRARGENPRAVRTREDANALG